MFLQLTKKAIIVYPNSGEVWDGIEKEWLVSRCFLPPSLNHSLYFSHSWLIWILYCRLIVFYRQPSKCFHDDDFGFHATRWRDLGAKIIGGCCRTTPSTIQIISNALRKNI